MVNSLTADSNSSVNYKMANEITAENQWWHFIDDSDVKASGTFKLSTGESLKIDLSKYGLSGYDNIYVAMVNESFNANVTITIKDSSN